MRLRVEEAERDQLRKPRFSDGSSSDVDLILLDHDGEPGTGRGLLLWSGFLYGRSMSVPSSDWPKNHTALDELFGLAQALQLSLDCGHVDGEDASIDAIRDLFNSAHDLHWKETVPTFLHDGSIVMQLLADFVVYGEQGGAYADLVDANLYVTNKDTHESLMHTSNELFRMFIQKGKYERAGLPAPDLMERCRYHSHANGQPCYLDK